MVNFNGFSIRLTCLIISYRKWKTLPGGGKMNKLLRDNSQVANPVHGQCSDCGSVYGIVGNGHDCGSSICSLCGAVVCMSYGLAKGTCPICYHGMLSGWSHGRAEREYNGKCSYKHCVEKYVAYGRGRKPICKVHAIHQGIVIPILPPKGWHWKDKKI